MKKRIWQFSNLLLSVFILVSTVAGVYSLPKTLRASDNFMAAGDDGADWHWIYSIASEQEGKSEEETDGDNQWYPVVKAFLPSTPSAAVPVAFQENLSDISPDDGIQLKQLYLLFNCLRLDPF